MDGDPSSVLALIPLSGQPNQLNPGLRPDGPQCRGNCTSVDVLAVFPELPVSSPLACAELPVASPLAGAELPVVARHPLTRSVWWDRAIVDKPKPT